MLALLIPADARVPVALLWLEASSATFSDAIGGGLLDDSLDAAVDQTLNGTADVEGYVVLLDEHRVPKGLPGNQRAAVLAARLGHLDRQWLADLRGDALIIGSRPTGADSDVPAHVIDAAARSGLLGPGIRTATHPATTCTWPRCSPPQSPPQSPVQSPA